jgi:molecular chaperone DnaJ
MAEKRDYYEVLGVDKGADKKTIKKAYRKLAMKFHPDVSDDPESSEKFKEISEAYAVLSDEDKRNKYDQFGHSGMEGFTYEDIFQNINFDDIFKGFGMDFESVFDRFGFGFGRRREGPQKGSDIGYDLNISLEEAAFGFETDIQVPHTKICPTCNGSRAEPGTEPRTCPKCGGSGQTQHVNRTIFGQFVSVSPCNNCRGEGKIIDTPCTNCRGKGKVQDLNKIHVKIPPGVDDGSRLRIPGEGDAGVRGGPPGDLYILIHVKPHKLFRREGANLIYEMPISFVQASLGDKVEVPTLEGGVNLKIPSGTQTGTSFRIRGKGMPHLNYGGRGNLNIKVKVITPKKLSPKQKELLREFADVSGDEIYTEDKGFFDKVKDVITH